MTGNENCIKIVKFRRGISQMTEWFIKFSQIPTSDILLAGSAKENRQTWAKHKALRPNHQHPSQYYNYCYIFNGKSHCSNSTFNDVHFNLLQAKNI